MASGNGRWFSYPYGKQNSQGDGKQFYQSTIEHSIG